MALLRRQPRAPLARAAVALRLAPGLVDPRSGATLARDRSGRLVTLAVLTPARGRARAVRRRLTRIVGVVHRGVQRTIEIHDLEDGALAVVQEVVSGPTLTRLVRSPGGLGAARAERVLADLADALAALHAAGVSHGDLSPDGVVVRSDVAVLVGLAEDGALRFGARDAPVVLPRAPERRTDPAPPPSPASDVWELAALLAWALAAADRPDRALSVAVQEVLERASDPRADRRPAAADLSAVVRASGTDRTGDGDRGGAGWGEPTPEDTVLRDLVQEAEREVVLRAPVLRPGRRRGGRGPAAGVAAAVVLAAVAVGLADPLELAPAGTTASGVVVSSSPVATGPVERALTLRDRALGTGGLGDLARAVVPGSAAWARDAALLGALRRERTRLEGLRTVVVARDGGGAVTLWQASHSRSVDGVPMVVGPQAVGCVRPILRPGAEGARLTDLVACG